MRTPNLLLENTAGLSLAENWDRIFFGMTDKPLTAIFWNQPDIMGEKFLNELPFLQINPEKLPVRLN